jgi:hypothetical protein
VLPRVSGLAAAATVLVAVTACSSTSADEPGAAPASSGTPGPSGPSASSASPAAAPSPAITGADGGPVVASPGTGTLGPGFVTPTAPPPPGGTMTPSAGSWAGVTVPPGYTVALLSTDDSAAARHLTDAVKAWATAAGVRLELVPAHDPTSYLVSIEEAIGLDADLVVCAGDPLADPLALVTASWLDQEFLLLGAELAEPTSNVTAAVWKGTTARGGGGGAGNAWTYDPSTFTVERARRALDAGVAAVLRGYAGFVVRVD